MENSPVLDILYNDSDIVAINKPSGLLVHRTSLATDRVTCLQLLRAQLDSWVYPIHRLDRGTSGVLLFALSSERARELSELFRSHDVTKRYLVIVRGYAPEQGDIDHAFSDPDDDLATIEARTAFRRLATVELPYPVGNYDTARYSLVQAEPLTGRTHQIRRHMKHISHQVVGDTTYGDGRQNRLFRERFNIHRMLLHAHTLCLPHPDGTGTIRIEAPLPEDFQFLFREFGWDLFPLAEVRG